MPHIIDSGKLLGASEVTSWLHLGGKYATRFGLLLSGTFGTGPGITKINVLPESAGVRDLNRWSTDGSSRPEMAFNKAGLYFIECPMLDIRLDMSSGEAGVTDIDYVIFVQARP